MNEQEIDELAVLQALDLLDDSEREMIESAIADSPGLEAELAEWREAAATIAYGALPMPMPENLEDRLFERIDREEAGLIREFPDLAELKQYAATIEWEDYPYSEGVKIGTYAIDEANRQIECFLWAQTTTVFPNHRHGSREEILVLEGELEVDNQRYRAGDRIAAGAGSTHQPFTQTGCLVFLRTSLDNEILT